MALLGQSHGPARNHCFRAQYHVGNLSNLGARDSALLDDLLPGHCRDYASKLLKAVGLRGDESLVDYLSGPTRLFLENLLAQSLEKGEVSAQTHLDEVLGDFRARTEEMQHVLGMFETV